MKIQKRAVEIAARIKKITDDRNTAVATFELKNDSVQAELRLGAEWTIRVPLDEVHCPRDLSGDNQELWGQMWTLAQQTRNASVLAAGRLPGPYPWSREIIPLNARTKSGPERRAEEIAAWTIQAGTQFLAAYRAATKKANIAAARAKIAGLQAQQKALLPQLREKNSRHVAGQKTARLAQAAKNAEALKSGRFWEADTKTLKGYFHPPFDKNYLADVSEKWRAALFVECESESYKTYSGNWGHKLVGTGRGYLCGVDDNGDEWGQTVADLPQSHDEHGNASLDTTVEDAMSVLFDIPVQDLDKCRRQGDLLFCPTTIRREDSPEHCRECGEPPEKHVEKTVETGEKYRPCPREWSTYDQYRPHIHKAPILEPESEWIPRESHKIASPSLRHNGTFFESTDPITVTHTSHPTLVLPAGEYRLYMAPEVDAD